METRPPSGFTRRELGGMAIGAGLAGSLPASSTMAMALQAGRPSRAAEVKAIRDFAETTHPRGAEAARDPAWMQAGQSLAQDADRLSEPEYVARLVRLLSWFEDGHTMVQTFRHSRGPFALRLPLRIETYYDGILVAQAAQDAAPLLGTRLTHVGAKPIAEVVRSFVDLWRTDSTAFSYRMLQPLFFSPGLMHGMGLVSGSDDAPVELRAVRPDGSTVAASVRPVAAPPADGHPLLVPPDWPSVQRGPSARELFAAGQKAPNYLWPIPERKALFLGLDTLEQPRDQFDLFYSSAAEALQQPQFERVIIDLRRNNGGNNDNGEPLRKTLERSRFNRPGGIYVLTGPVTFSAAQNVATRLERETFALFVGEPTGGSPNHYGDAKSFEGPATGMPVRVSTVPWFDSSPFDKRNSIFPDIFVPALVADALAGRDPALEAALAHVDDRKDDDRTRTFRWARKSQEGKWSPFWMAGA